MATRFVLTPFAAEFASNPPELTLVNNRPVLAFDAAQDQQALWTFVWPQGMTSTYSLIVFYIMASATSGTVDFEASIEAVTDADAVDLDATSSFDTANTMTADTVPGTAGHLGTFTITLSNIDSAAAGDYVRLLLKRDADDASNDTATGDCHVLAVELRDSA